MRVLYVNHTAQVSGGERSLLDLLRALPANAQPLLATPKGRLAEAAERLGVPVTTIPGTAGSLKPHPIHTPRTLGELTAAGVAVRLAARRHQAQLIHANSIRAGVAIGLARPPLGTVVHVRDCLPPGRLSAATLRLIGASATTVVANSQYTADSVRRMAPRARTEVVYNPVDLERWDPARIDRVHARVRLKEVRRQSLLLGVVAQLTPWKGQDTAVEALRLLRREGLDVHLLLIGAAKFVASSTRHDNEAYVAGLRRQVTAAGLDDRVSWLGEREDVPELISALDVLLLPSWEEPFGRAVTEAMALRVPVVATAVGGPAEIITDGSDGLLAAPRDPEAWAAAVRRLADDPALAQRLGRAGRLRVEAAFGLDRHVAAMFGVYERVLTRAGE